MSEMERLPAGVGQLFEDELEPDKLLTALMPALGEGLRTIGALFICEKQQQGRE